MEKLSEEDVMTPVTERSLIRKDTNLLMDYKNKSYPVQFVHFKGTLTHLYYRYTYAYAMLRWTWKEKRKS